jgi:hypothetical protein
MPTTDKPILATTGRHGDTLMHLGTDAQAKLLEVLSKGGQEGVYVRTWGAHDNILSRTDLTANEALDLAQALIYAATTSIRFNAGVARR